MIGNLTINYVYVQIRSDGIVHRQQNYRSDHKKETQTVRQYHQATALWSVHFANISPFAKTPRKTAKKVKYTNPQIHQPPTDNNTA